MKFVCIECDEPMKLRRNEGMDDDGSLSVSFQCPSCEWGVALLMNPQETQMVSSLGVTIGGDAAAHQPMAMLRTHLASQGAEEPAGSGSSCPFSALVQDAYAEAPKTLQWSAEAQGRLNNVPSFVRTMAQKGIEEFALEQGCAEITPQVMDAARERMGM